MSSVMNVCVVGANGKMGQEILKVLSQSKKAKPFLGVARKEQAQGFLNSAKNLAIENLKKVDVIIDFSTADNFSQVLKIAVQAKIPLVSGVTGISEKQEAEKIKAAQSIPLLWASNMSLGVAMLRKALEVFADLPKFDFQIEEFHHNKKKDRPSGTAKTLQQDLNRITKIKNPEPLSIRGGGIFGIHKVHAMSEDEHIVFEHMALNRAVFAAGAVRAAEWLVEQKKGLYDMRDVIK